MDLLKGMIWLVTCVLAVGRSCALRVLLLPLLYLLADQLFYVLSSHDHIDVSICVHALLRS